MSAIVTDDDAWVFSIRKDDADIERQYVVSDYAAETSDCESGMGLTFKSCVEPIRRS